MVGEEEFKKEMTNPSLELKVLPTNLKYAILEANNFPMIVSTYLTCEYEHVLVELLRKYKKSIGRNIADI